MSHTPGPWWVEMPEGWDEYSEPLIIGGEDDLIANIRRDLTKPEGGAFGEGYYDCLLIAAAPDLLAFVERWENEITDGGILDKLQGWQREFAEEARAVLAKAKGE